MATPGVIPLHIFRFRVEVSDDSLTSGPKGQPTVMDFAECTGLEATMEPKTIKEGGRNYGAAQRTGAVTFATVVLKRGVSEDRGMWNIFNVAVSGQYAPRLRVTISMLDGDLNPFIESYLRAIPYTSETSPEGEASAAAAAGSKK